MKRGKRGEWTDITERGPGYTDARPLIMAFRGEKGLYFTIARRSPHERWMLQCTMFDLGEDTKHSELAAAQNAAIVRIRKELVRISDDLDLAQRRIA